MKWFWLAVLLICLCSFGLVHVAAFLFICWVVLFILGCF